MNLQLIYFDDLPQNLEIYKLVLKDSFDVLGFSETDNHEAILTQYKPHGIMLDLHMPGQDGIMLHEKILRSSQYNGCPIFFISSDPTLDSRIKIIQSGAIDFFQRDISVEELKLRLFNKIRMFMHGSKVIDVGNLRLNFDDFNVFIAGVAIDLTLIETRILFSIVKSLPHPLEKDDLIEKIWGKNSGKGTIQVHLSNLNTKLNKWNYEIKLKDSSFMITSV